MPSFRYVDEYDGTLFPFAQKPTNRVRTSCVCTREQNSPIAAADRSHRSFASATVAMASVAVSCLWDFTTDTMGMPSQAHRMRSTCVPPATHST